MKFSIIIPAYNSSQYIRKGLDSIKKQCYNDYELIVICDNCIDTTEQIASEYGAIVKPVKFNNDGVARSMGLNIAKGDYVMFMDDDDWWLHEFVLSMIAEKLEKENYPDVLCFGFIFKGAGYARPKQRDGKYWTAIWQKCWKREKIGSTRFPNVPAISDRYFHEAMMKKELRIVEWDMPFYYYNYLRPGSISHGLGRKVNKNIMEMI